jgi:hypothetical protein
MRFTSRSAVLSFASSALYPDFRILRKVAFLCSAPTSLYVGDADPQQCCAKL